VSDGFATVRLPIIGKDVLPKTDEIVQVLARLPFFKNVEAKMLRDLAARSILRHAAPEQAIMKQGEYGHSLFVLLRGVVRIECITETGQVAVLDRLSEPGHFTGEAAVLGNARRSSSAIAELQSVVLEIEKARLEAVARAASSAEILTKLSRESESRIITAFVSQHSLFGGLQPNLRKQVFELAHISRYSRNDVIFEEGQEARTVLLVKAGLVRLERVDGDQVSVLGYFNVGDVAGAFEKTRSGRLVSAGFAEIIDVPAIDFAILEAERPELLEHFKKTEVSRASRQRSVVVGSNPTDGSATILGFLDDFVSDGAQEAQSLLTIDLDLCIRCGNCTRACESRHGRARMTRRGKELVRRLDPKKPDVHQTLLFTSSCRHCVNPECMVGCPTGAIHRKPTGEVDIHDFCIGCNNCAIRCPWGNITMAPTPGRMVTFDGVREERAMIASKCNLCVGYDEANCVHNCPTGAIIRLEPNQFFPEVRDVLGIRDKEALGEGKTSAKKPIQFVWRFLVPFFGLLAIGGLIALRAIAAKPFWPGSKFGLIMGATALSALFASALLARRRRVAHRRSQLGEFKIWARAHTWLGAVAFLGAAFHSSFRANAFLTSSLLLLVSTVFLLGVAGMLFQKWMPKAITRLEGSSQLEEDLLEEQGRLRSQNEKLLQEHEALKKLAQDVRAAAGSPWSRFPASYDERRARDQAIGRVSARRVPDDSRVASEQLVLGAVRLVEIQATLMIYRWRRIWLMLHISAAVPLLLFAVLHVVSVLYYRSI
jgi:Fe-S-cluster-containing dehydrogenase component/CRP-like cAMP-binding protein